MTDQELIKAARDGLRKRAYVAPLAGAALGAGAGVAAGGSTNAAAGGAAIGAGLGAASYLLPGPLKGIVGLGGKSIARAASSPWGMLTLATTPMEAKEVASMATGIHGRAAGKQRAAQAAHQAALYKQGSSMKWAGFSREEMVKAASIKKHIADAASKLPHDPMTIFGAALALGAAGAVVGAGQMMASEGMTSLGELGRKAGRTKQYTAMVKADPTLRESKQSRTYFNVLHRASPFLASEPVLAAATVRSMVDAPSLTDGGLPYVTTKQIGDILEVEMSRKNIRAPGKAFQPSKPVDVVGSIGG